MIERECKTQADVDATIAAGDVVVVRSGRFVVRDSASVYAYDDRGEPVSIGRL